MSNTSWPTCDMCQNPSAYMRKDVVEHVHRACVEHEPYLETWVKSVNSEVASENAAAAQYEDYTHGRDDEQWD